MPTILPSAFVNGVWNQSVMSGAAGVVSVINPGHIDQGTIAEYPWHLEDASRAIQSARDAFPSWRAMEQDEREAVLRRAQEGIRSAKEDIAQNISAEMGKPIVQARLEVDAIVRKFDITLPDAAKLLRPQTHPDDRKTTVRGEPLGVAGIIGPYNFPGHLVNGMVLPALATGNTVVLKPASVTPGVWRIITEKFESAGLPPGVLNYVVGDRRVGEMLAESELVDLILFTGGIPAGRAIKRRAANTHKEVKLEMGGQGVALVLEDADLEKAADLVAKGATIRGGQNCNATRNVFVVGTQRFEQMKDLLVERFRRLRVGPQESEDIDLGPLATDPQRDFFKNLNAVLDIGAQIVFETELPVDLPPGYYVSPTLYLRPKNTYRAFDIGEIFGPALAMTLVDSAEEGLALMNLQHLRLSAAIHSGDAERAWRLAIGSRWGQTVINEMTVGASSFVDFAGLGEATYGGSGGRAMTEHTIRRVNIIG